MRMRTRHAGAASARRSFARRPVARFAARTRKWSAVRVRVRVRRLQLAPLLGTLFVIFANTWSYARVDQRAAGAKHTYWLARMLLVRGTGQGSESPRGWGGHIHGDLMKQDQVKQESASWRRFCSRPGFAVC